MLVLFSVIWTFGEEEEVKFEQTPVDGFQQFKHFNFDFHYSGGRLRFFCKFWKLNLSKFYFWAIWGLFSKHIVFFSKHGCYLIVNVSQHKLFALLMSSSASFDETQNDKHWSVIVAIFAYLDFLKVILIPFFSTYWKFRRKVFGKITRTFFWAYWA